MKEVCLGRRFDSVLEMEQWQRPLFLSLLLVLFLHPQSFGSDLHVISEVVSDRAWEKGNVILFVGDLEQNSPEIEHFSTLKIG